MTNFIKCQQTNNHEMNTTDKLYICIHHHQHGVDTALIQAPEFPTTKQVAETLDWEIDEAMGEYVDCFEIDEVRCVDGTVKSLFEKPPVPKVVVYHDGGIILGTSSTAPVDLTFVDSDYDGGGDEYVYQFEDVSKYVRQESADVSPKDVEYILSEIDRQDRERANPALTGTPDQKEEVVA